MKVKISDIKPNPNNPRIIKDDKFKKLVKSIMEFPEMLEKRPLVCFTDFDGKLIVLGGNMRLKAAKKSGLKEISVMLADDWTEEQRQQFLIKDNVGFGDWNWDDLISGWDREILDCWGLDIPDSERERIVNQFESDQEEDNVEDSALSESEPVEANMIAISLTSEENTRWVSLKNRLKIKNDKKAFFNLLEKYENETGIME